LTLPSIPKGASALAIGRRAELEGSKPARRLWSGFGLLVGSLLAGYFLYLAILKRKLKRKAN